MHTHSLSLSHRQSLLCELNGLRRDGWGVLLPALCKLQGLLRLALSRDAAVLQGVRVELMDI